MHLWSHPHTASNSLRIEATGQRYKQTTEFVYLGGAISESADLDIEIKRRIGAAWASVRKCSSQLYDLRNARLSLKIRLFKAEVMKDMLYGCATWTMRSQDLSSLHNSHAQVSPRVLFQVLANRRREDEVTWGGGKQGYLLCIGTSKRLGFREINRRTLVLNEGEWYKTIQGS